jgi:syntaxin 5
VDELTGLIKQDINSLNQAIVDLQRTSLHAAKDGASIGSKQAQDHNHTVVDNLRLRLKDATQVT